jgi:hypothetical protein
VLLVPKDKIVIAVLDGFDLCYDLDDEPTVRWTCRMEMSVEDVKRVLRPSLETFVIVEGADEYYHDREVLFVEDTDE